MHWGQPLAPKWANALVLEDVKGLDLDGFNGSPTRTSAGSAAVIINRIENGLIRNCRAEQGTPDFLHIGTGCNDLVLLGNDVHHAEKFWTSDQPLKPGIVREQFNLLRAD